MLKITVCTLIALLITINVGFVHTVYAFAQNDYNAPDYDTSYECTLITPHVDDIEVKKPPTK